MPRATLLFGNGLGLALNTAYFRLDNALRIAWGVLDQVALSEEDKRRVARCVGTNDITNAPTTEDQLELLQRVIAACDFLNEVGDDQVHWLSGDARPFPEAVRRYLGRAATYLHSYNGEALPTLFMNSLDAFIRATNAHVATLNYDNLLYQPFIARGLCEGYDGWLVDGFYRDGFAQDNMERRFGRKFGWYMHLHGCPLFAEEHSGTIRKLSIGELHVSYHMRKHLILAHHRFKSALIQSSPLLRAYLEYFQRALRESSQLVVFGYSGLDTHINQIVNEMRRSTFFILHVVEWDGSGPYNERQVFWNTAFGPNTILTQRSNILDYRFEALLPEPAPVPPLPF